MENSFSGDVFRSTKTLSYLALGGLAAIALTEFTSVLLGFGQIVSPEIGLDEGEPFWLVMQSLVAALELLIQIFTIVFFLIWLNRSNKNLTPLRVPSIEYSSGWSVGWWFVPFANLVKPFNVVQEVWRESDPDFDPDLNFLTNSLGTSSLLYAWWAFWIISNIATNISSRMFDAVDVKSLEITGYVFIISGTLTTIAAVLAVKVVREITDRQERRFAKVEEFRPAFMQPPPPPTF